MLHHVGYLNEIQQHECMKLCLLKHDTLHQTSGACTLESYKLAERKEEGFWKGSLVSL